MRSAVQLTICRLLAVVAIVFATHSASRAAAWSDNFNDGSITDNNPVPWLTDLGGSGIFPGAYDASSGDLFLDPSDDSPTGQMSAFVPTVSFTNTYVRAQGKVLPDPNNPANNGGNLVLTARINPSDLTGYLVYFDVSGNLNIQTLLGGGTQDLTTTVHPGFNASSEVVMEFDVVGTQLSAYVWLADDPAGKPAAPQITATNDFFTSGVAGVAYSEDDPFTSCIYRYVSAQDTPFIDVPPGVPGDYNNNGVVDAADYALWRNGGPLANEVDNPGTVDANDFTAWRARFSNTSGSGSGLGAAAVPEPTVVMLVATGFVLSMLGVGRRGGR